MPSGVVISVVALNTSVVIFSVLVPASDVITSGTITEVVLPSVGPIVLAIVSPVVAGPSVDCNLTDVPLNVSVGWAVLLVKSVTICGVAGWLVVSVGGIVVTGSSVVVNSFIVVDAPFVGPTLVTGPSDVMYPVDLVGSD